MSGRLAGIAWRVGRRAAMEEAVAAAVTVEAGVAGDHKGSKFKNRQVTILAVEDWHAALDDLKDGAGLAPNLSWTARRANLLVEGVRLPRAKGARIVIGGNVELEITGETVPCGRMDEALPGLLKALYPAWRGGVTCCVLSGGRIQRGDVVEITFSPPEFQRRLPG